MGNASCQGVLTHFVEAERVDHDEAADGAREEVLQIPEETCRDRVEKASTGSTNPKGSDTDSDKEPLELLLRDLEQTYALTMSRYQNTVHHPQADAKTVHKADELMRRLQQTLRRAALTKNNSWHGEADLFLNMHTGGEKRFKSLQEVVRQVQVETRIIRRWRKRNKSMPLQLPNRDIELDVDSWDGVNVFRIDDDCKQPLTQVFMSIWATRHLDLLSKSPEDSALKFILALEASYLENPYHDRKHAADVTHTAYYFWTHLASQTHMRDYYTEADLLAIIVAAAIHDVAHPGVSNEFMVKTQDTLALQYNDRSVLEHYHAATAFSIMKEVGANLLDHKLVNPPAESLKARVVDMVLATDMAHHKRVVDDTTAEIRGRPNMQDVDKLVLEKHMLHMADIAHPLRPPAQHQKWSDLIRQEFFAQGDMEKSLGHQPGPLFDREKSPSLAKSQVGFLNFVVIPTWKPLYQALGSVAKTLDKYLQANLEDWKEAAKKEDAGAQKLLASPCRSRRSTTEF
mmetsp:Transcript_81488/g.205072  ORF Transcript_81488/g.205072 Transcript_81488/m.205072 type:complete len:514 (-) Transcript_81488:270-1811(-)|eukprot:CAMPEP_0115246638 /NCGR_PEP_ID=MMETSP0270-20121206/41131_1 /TAXON_ID=71861 /ORGANISM="Scrippsiella trochoidea, Strain CCMP3099" /LENGTH=513 /DNA_ID=CAMNT_0002661861 /DNA_START=38 /DNA_END=1579 /DNA_ORIENTATION=-